MSAKPIGKMIGGIFGGVFRDTAAEGSQPPAHELDADAGTAAPDAPATATVGGVSDLHRNAPAAEAPDAPASATVGGVSDVQPSADTDSAAVSDAGAPDPDVLEERLIDAMRSVYDPEIPVDIYELGLIYSLRVRPGGIVDIEMTLTTPNCPVAGSMPGMVERVARMVDGVTDVHVELVWEPIWNPDMMSEAARLQLNMY